jgi:hypothetical protein
MSVSLKVFGAIVVEFTVDVTFYHLNNVALRLDNFFAIVVNF